MDVAIDIMIEFGIGIRIQRRKTTNLCIPYLLPYVAHHLKECCLGRESTSGPYSPRRAACYQLHSQKMPSKLLMRTLSASKNFGALKAVFTIGSELTPVSAQRFDG
jgi:hypothetical protein